MSETTRRDRSYPMPGVPTHDKPIHEKEETHMMESKYTPDQDYPGGKPAYPQQYPYDNLDLPKGDLKGYLQAYTLDPDRDPNRVLERYLPWYIVCEWGISGTVAPAFGGTWHLTGYAESIGPDKGSTSEVKLFEETVDVDEVDPAKRRDYRLEITVPPEAIPQDGAFKVVLLLTHSNEGKSGIKRFSRLAGFVEIPMLQFYSSD